MPCATARPGPSGGALFERLGGQFPAPGTGVPDEAVRNGAGLTGRGRGRRGGRSPPGGFPAARERDPFPHPFRAGQVRRLRVLSGRKRIAYFRVPVPVGSPRTQIGELSQGDEGEGAVRASVEPGVVAVFVVLTAGQEEAVSPVPACSTGRGRSRALPRPVFPDIAEQTGREKLDKALRCVGRSYGCRRRDRREIRDGARMARVGNHDPTYVALASGKDPPQLVVGDRPVLDHVVRAPALVERIVLVRRSRRA